MEYFLLLFCHLVFVFCQEKMSFESPSLDDEEMHSSHMPVNMKCDACTAVVYQLNEFLKKEETRRGGRKLLESEYLDAIDNACEPKTYENYGIKKVDTGNRLSGKGLEADNVPGMLMGGGKWPSRLASKCFEYIDLVGEDDIYNNFRNKRNLKQFLCRERTSDCRKKQKEKEL